VVAAITPWNAPLYLNVTESVPALLAGNAVILKPAQLTPWAGLELGRIAAEETDLPSGIFQVIVSNDNDVAATLTSDPRVDMVTFTGSTAVGRKILAAAAPTVKKTVMELGGKSTHIVLDDADLAQVLPRAAGGVCTGRPGSLGPDSGAGGSACRRAEPGCDSPRHCPARALLTDLVRNLRQAPARRGSGRGTPG
jgi:acyl-CoA reductase-like NAD-dependent aldehyde dehydrogenase